jgi:hypothetical protein
MTEPDEGRQTRIVPVAGRSIVVKQMTDMQLLHLGRMASILRSDEVESDQKVAVAGKMLKILHSCVSAADQEFLEEQEMIGNLTLRQMVGFVNAFQEPEDAPATVSRPKRGRAVR